MPLVPKSVTPAASFLLYLALIYNKTITISILKQISPGLNKEDFLNILEVLEKFLS